MEETEGGGLDGPVVSNRRPSRTAIPYTFRIRTFHARATDASDTWVRTPLSWVLIENQPGTYSQAGSQFADTIDAGRPDAPVNTRTLSTANRNGAGDANAAYATQCMGCGVGRTGVGPAEFSGIKAEGGKREEGGTGPTCGLGRPMIPGRER